MVIHYVNQALLITLYLSAPIVIATSILGLTLGLIQAVFQLQDQAMPFGIKWVLVILLLVAVGPWMANMLIEFSDLMFILMYTR